MTSQGSAIPAYKAAFVSALQAVAPFVTSYQSPISLADALGSDGSGESVFWLDEIQTDYALNVIHGPNLLQFDETAELTLVIQVVGRNTDDTQTTIDSRVSELQYEALRIIAGSPDLVLPTSDISIVRASPSAGKWESGVDSQNMRGVRAELGITLEARISAAD